MPLFECSQCGENFKRQEHLSRHTLSHNAEKPFSCPRCHKSFTRRDTLSRHLTIHRSETADQGINLRSAVSRVSQACTNCARSRLRCDGQKPCGRCSSKNTCCTYRPGIRTRIRSVNLNQDSVSSASEAESNQRGSTGSRSLIPTAIQQREHGAGSDDGSSTSFMESRRESKTGRSPSDADTSDFHMAMASDQDVSMPSPSSGGGREMTASVGAAKPPICAESSRWYTAGMYQGQFLGDFQGQATHSDFGSPEFAFDAHLDTGFDLTDWPFFMEDLSEARAPPRILPFPVPEPNQPQGWGSTSFQARPTTQNYSFEPPDGQVLSEPTKDFSKTRRPEQSPNKSSKTSRLSIASRSGSNTPPFLPIATVMNAEKASARNKWPLHWSPEKSDSVVIFPDLSGIPRNVIDAENFSHVKSLDQSTYDRIVECLQDAGEKCGYRPFVNSVLPPLSAMNCFVQLYFEYFNPVFPLLHQPTFDPSKTHWLLVLAVAAIGCHYSQINTSSKCANALQELLRRAIQLVIENDNSSVRKIWLAQACLLNCLGMLYSGNRRLLELSMVFRSTGVTQSRRNGSLVQTSCPISIDESIDGPALESKWTHWIQQEELRRFGFCTMIYDCQFPLYFGSCPSMEFRELKQQLPCSEEMWEAPNSTEWKKHALRQKQTTESPLFLNVVLDRLSSGTKVPEMGTFAKIIVIHAIHRNIWDMKQCEETPLVPTLNAEQKQNWNEKIINILKSMEPSKGGTEHALISNLETHISLILLLLFLPIQELLNFVRPDLSPQESQQARQKVNTWMGENEGQTARHAVVYASALFSKIRPRSTSAFYDPAAFLISTLTLWTFSQLSGCQDVRSVDVGLPAAQHMQTIRLDRIRADEVEEWVKRGNCIRGYLGEVGNINDADTGNQLLRVAVGYLGAMETWALAQGFVSALSMLYERYKSGEETTCAV